MQAAINYMTRQLGHELAVRRKTKTNMAILDRRRSRQMKKPKYHCRGGKFLLGLTSVVAGDCRARKSYLVV